MEKTLAKSSHVKYIVTYQDFLNLLAAILSFFIGRVVVFQTLNPLAIAFLSNFYFKGVRYYIVLTFVGLGLLTKASEINLLKYIVCLLLMSSSNYILQRSRLFSKKADSLTGAVVGGFSILLSGLLISALNNFSVFFALLALLEGIMTFSLAYVLKKSTGFFQAASKKRTITNEELLSLAILSGGVVAGAADVYVANISLMVLFLTILILTVAYKSSAAVAAVSGLLFALLLLLSDFCNVEFVVILSVAGLAAGSLSGMGKAYTALGFILSGTLAAFYLDKGLLNMELLFSVLLGSAVFLIVPNKLYITVNQMLNSGIDNTDEYISRVREVTTNKLTGFSRAFKKLSKTFGNISYKKKSLDQRDVSKLIDDVAARACSNCNLKAYCWENNFYNTYQTIFSILAACEKKGRIDVEDIPVAFKEACINVVNFADVTNRLFEIYKLNLVWHNRIVQSRELVCEQLYGVSSIIDNIADELDIELKFKDDLEKKLADELLKNKIDVDSVIVLENKHGRYEVSIKHKECGRKKFCVKELLPIVNKVLGRKMDRDSFECNTIKQGRDSICKLRLIEQQKFRVTTGKAAAVKTDSPVSGDSYTVMTLSDGRFLMALSDGMGSGDPAREQSAATLELFEDFIETGFEKDTAINMINSVLVLKSNEESFATLDICTVDLYSGVAEFAKIGAASAFLVHNGKIEVIKSTSLPVGILNNVDIEINRKKLNEKDLIIMVTDGVIDSKKDILSKELWMMEILQSLDSGAPQDIADYILDEAKKNNSGVVRDDMTVLVSRVWNY